MPVSAAGRFAARAVLRLARSPPTREPSCRAKSTRRSSGASRRSRGEVTAAIETPSCGVRRADELRPWLRGRRRSRPGTRLTLLAVGQPAIAAPSSTAATASAPSAGARRVIKSTSGASGRRPLEGDRDGEAVDRHRGSAAASDAGSCGHASTPEIPADPLRTRLRRRSADASPCRAPDHHQAHGPGHSLTLAGDIAQRMLDDGGTAASSTGTRSWWISSSRTRGSNCR